MKVLCHPDYDAGLLVTDAKGQVRKLLNELLPEIELLLLSTLLPTATNLLLP